MCCRLRIDRRCSIRCSKDVHQLDFVALRRDGVQSLTRTIAWQVASNSLAWRMFDLRVDDTRQRLAGSATRCLSHPRRMLAFTYSLRKDAWKECREVFGEGNVLIVSNSVGAKHDAGQGRPSEATPTLRRLLRLSLSRIISLFPRCDTTRPSRRIRASNRYARIFRRSGFRSSRRSW